nr:protein TIC 100 [Ipomoea trifida]
MADDEKIEDQNAANNYSTDSDSEEEEEYIYEHPATTRAETVRRFVRVLNKKKLRRELEEEETEGPSIEEEYDFPVDPEKWTEEDVKELWADPPVGSGKTGWDPSWVDAEDEEMIRGELREGRDPYFGPFYVPYRKPFPAVPDNHHEIATPKAVIEELDKTEEFMRWVSYIFDDGSSYEGTVWDDKAHGKGVFVGEKGLVRYEGEWLHNEMEGHGVVEVEIPHMQPVPGSKLEKKMRAKGKIITRDSMDPEDREWLEMDIVDSVRFAAGKREIPFYDKKIWIKHFGEKPEKGRYRYSGQWKHGRMHGCGVYEVNERTIYGRFYFGEFLDLDTYGCDLEICATHAGIAEVAAAKARMFTNKPDGMVREDRGPYSDPQHPYFYEEDDVWMAPGFINQFYEVPDYWKMYVHEVDEEREMWLNSFYKAPLRLPMPAELEYWWANDEEPEFILINREPEPDPEDPSKLIYTEDPLIMHTPTGKIIDYVDDEEHGIRLFWAPDVKDGEEDENIDDVEFLPLGFDEFYGRETYVEEEQVHFLKRFIVSVENACKPIFTKLEKWVDEQKKASEMKMALLKKELELAEAEFALNEAIEDLDEALKLVQQEEERKAEMGIQEEEGDTSPSKPTDQSKKTTTEKEEEDEEEEEDEGDDDAASFSFGSVENQDKAKTNQNGNKPGKSSPFGASSLPFAACSLVSQGPSKLLHSFMTWKEGKTRQPPSSATTARFHVLPHEQHAPTSITFPNTVAKNCRLRATQHMHYHEKRECRLPMIVQSKHTARSKQKASREIQGLKEDDGSLSILSLHTPLDLRELGDSSLTILSLHMPLVA